MSKEIALADIVKELSNISGFRISIYDTNQNELEGYPKKGSAFCQLIQQNPKALSLCHCNDKKAFETARQTGEVYLYQCCFGLYEAVAPLYHNGILSGFLMMGQTLDAMRDSPSAHISDGPPLYRGFHRIETGCGPHSRALQKPNSFLHLHHGSLRRLYYPEQPSKTEQPDTACQNKGIYPYPLFLSNYAGSAVQLFLLQSGHPYQEFPKCLQSIHSGISHRLPA